MMYVNLLPVVIVLTKLVYTVLVLTTARMQMIVREKAAVVITAIVFLVLL